MSELTDRLDRDLREIAARAHPSASAWDSIVARLTDDPAPEVAPLSPTVRRRSTRRAWLAGAVAAALLLVGGAVAVLAGGGDDDTISTVDSDTTAEPSLAPPPTAIDFPNPDTTYVSATNGFSVDYYDRGEGALTRADEPWDPSAGQMVDDRFAPGVDAVETGFAAVFMGSSVALPDDVQGAEVDAWVDQHVSRGCPGPRADQAVIHIGGMWGRISECRGRVEATVVARDRLYLFTLLHTRSDGRAVFDVFARTIDLTPETAAGP
jgi:hypothetical protein